ncbi:hypothetical protein [Streptomyces omiyaensis]|uniref:DUF8017 domain-containing protein n=1 Tax=Streptomyces omiyaensis TaxID=68247 RepID=A0ABW7BKP3_9ACTN|nr:hypothetical protein [Streptomyces omiyaensis]GGY45635.1 hypothetical protein GCM10010363_27850 [Streptomyces omiyaensis]
MWPGQQPPGGEQNPQDQNQNPYQQPTQPGYQQPGHQQPNPYQQPTQPGYPQQGGWQQQPGYPQQGYAQPNPYQQPTQPQYQVPAPTPPQGSGGGSRRSTLIAVVAAAAVVVAAGVTVFLVTGGDDKKNVADKPTTTASAPGSDAPSTDPSGQPSEPSDGASTEIDNPRDGTTFQPTIPGWKVVHNPTYGTLFDVPPEWEVLKPTTYTGFGDAKKGDGSPLVVMSGPAEFKSKWCAFDKDKNGTPETWGLGAAGTKGNKGATDTASAARAQAGTWVWAAFAQHMPEKSIKVTAPVPYTTASGLKGSMATATAPNVTKRNKCETDGKSIAFTFLNAENDYATFLLYAADGVKDELPDATIQKILSTVRLTEKS